MTLVLTIAEADEKMCDAGVLEASENWVVIDAVEAQRIFKTMNAARPAICSDYWKAMGEVIEAAKTWRGNAWENDERWVECDRDVADRLSKALFRLRSLESVLEKELGKEP